MSTDCVPYCVSNNAPHFLLSLSIPPMRKNHEQTLVAGYIFNARVSNALPLYDHCLSQGLRSGKAAAPRYVGHDSGAEKGTLTFLKRSFSFFLLAREIFHCRARKKCALSPRENNRHLRVDTCLESRSTGSLRARNLLINKISVATRLSRARTQTSSPEEYRIFNLLKRTLLVYSKCIQ